MRVLLRRVMPGENLPEIHELQEVETMLAEYVEEWTEKWKREGLLAGRLEGEREGRLEGERKGKLEGKRDTLKRLLGRRFGELPPWASACIEEASVAQLDAWVDGIFAAETLETLLNDSPPASGPSAG